MRPFGPELLTAVNRTMGETRRVLTVRDLRMAILRLLANSPTHQHVVNVLGKPGAPGALERDLKVVFEEEERDRAQTAWDHLKTEGKIRPSMMDSVEPLNWFRIRAAGKRELAGVDGWTDDESVPSDEADDLTHLYRRGSLDRDAEDAVSFAREKAAPVSCLMIDLDDFKSINDKHGHGAGDQTLSRVAGCISSTTRRRGRAYRYGGDEFTVLLPSCPADEAGRVAEEIRNCVGALSNSFDGPLSVTIGTATTTVERSVTGRDLVAQADAALLLKKQDRKSSSSVGSGSISQRISITTSTKPSLELYEKRAPVYRAARRLIALALSNATITNAESAEFLKETSEAEFLFGTDVRDYLGELYSRALDLHSLSFRLAGNELPVGERRNQVVEEEREILDWFGKQATVVSDVFRPYLDLST